VTESAGFGGADGDFNNFLGNSLPCSDWPTEQTYAYVGLGYYHGCVLFVVPPSRHYA